MRVLRLHPVLEEDALDGGVVCLAPSAREDHFVWQRPEECGHFHSSRVERKLRRHSRPVLAGRVAVVRFQ